MAAASGSAEERLLNLCEAIFYVGQYYLLHGDQAKAGEHFRRARGTGVFFYIEHRMAQVELAKLVGESGPTHLDALRPLLDAVGDPAPAGLLGKVRFEPGNDTETALLGASDSAYRVVVTALRAMYGTEFGDYRNYYANVRDAINGTAELAVKPADGYRTIKLLEMARQSSLEGRTLPISF